MAAELNVAAISQSQAALVLQRQQQEEIAMEDYNQSVVGSNDAELAEDQRPGTPLEDEEPTPASAAMTVNGKDDNNGDTGQLDDDDDSDEEENVNVVIKSNAATAPIGVMAAAAHQHLGGGGPAVNSASAGASGTVFKGGVGQLTGTGTRAVQHKTSGVEIDMIPTVNGVLLTEMDLEALEDKPWRLPGADISDYFNYGFTEETWAAYCDRQRRLRAEATAKGMVIGNKLMTGGTNDHKTPQMIQTISRTDNFSEEQKSLLGPAVTTNALGASMGLGAPPVVASSVASVVSAITSSNTINDITSFMNAAAAADAKSAAAVANAAVASSNGTSALTNVLANSMPKLGSDPGSMLPPPFMPPGMPPMPPPFGLPPFPGMPSGPPPGFPGMPPGFPAFPPAAAIPANAPSAASSSNRNPVAEIEFKTEPPSTPPPDEFGSKAGGEDEIITMKEYKKRERERDYRDHSPRERESKRRHHRERDRDRDRDRDRSEERGRRRRGGHSDEESTAGGTSGMAASSSEDKKTYKRSSKRHHKDHHRDHHRSRSRDRTPTNDE